MFAEYVRKVNELQDACSKNSAMIRALYMEHVFLTWRWWLCFAMMVVPWILWIIFRKKDSTARLLFAGFFTTIVAMLLDDIGVELNYWDYHVDIDAINPSFLLWDMTLLPIATMTLLQFKPRIHPVYKAVVLGLLAAFVVEPPFARMDFYDPECWRHIYSFPIYVVIYLIAHLCATRVSFEKLHVRLPNSTDPGSG